MTDRYAFWRDSLAGKKPAIVNEDPQPGFYRMKRGNGWIPVAVWQRTPHPGYENLGFKIGSDVVGAQVGIEQWHWYAPNAITEAVYRAVAERGENWPDADPTVSAMLKETIKYPAGGLEITNILPAAEPKPLDPIEDFREQIKTALDGLGIYAKIETDERDVQALSLRNMLNELAKDADKAREAEKAPHWKKCQSIDAKWQPLIKEAREGAGKIKDARDQWANDKRQAEIDAQRRADEALAEQMREAAEKGEQNAPIAAPVAQSNLPPPTTQVRPTYGRASSTGTKVVVTNVDFDKMFVALKSRPDLWERFKEIMLEIAQKCASKGIILDGVKTEERASTR